MDPPHLQHHLINERYHIETQIDRGEFGRRSFKIKDLKDDDHQIKAATEYKLRYIKDFYLSIRDGLTTLGKLDSPFFAKYLDYYHDSSSYFAYVITPYYHVKTPHSLLNILNEFLNENFRL